MTRESSIKTGFRRTTADRGDMDDPLTLALAPPDGETLQQAELRVRAERAAVKVSDDIDKELRLEVQVAKRRRCVKVLLLGQSESGKSTVLKNFQRKYDPSAFDRERAVWRSVCQLNVVRSFGIILDVLNHVFEEQDRQHHSHPITPPTTPGPTSTSTTTNPNPNPNPNPSTDTTTDKQDHSLTLTPEHRRLTMRLAPLRQIEHALTRRFRTTTTSSSSSSSSSSNAFAPPPLSPPHSPLTPSRTSPQELYVSGYAWQRAREHRHCDDGGAGGGAGPGADDEDEALSRVLCACREDMVALWTNPVVRRILRDKRVGMEELSGFFLDDLARIAVQGYAPTDDDVLHARLKTIGVTEHRFTIRPKIIEAEHLSAADFRIYDVGGSRNQRATWMPFFDDVNAIVFLAPMSPFDQTLVEAPEVNRLEDTFALWKTICSSKLLSKVSLVLLLNKRDVLQRKLENGVSFSRYVKSYTGKNQWDAVAKYLKTKFKAVQREFSPTPRIFYSHITCATDTKQMAVILAAIEDLVLRRNLEEINLL